MPSTGSGNEWFEYDVTDDPGQAVVSKTEDSTAIDALLQMQAVDAAGKVKESRCLLCSLHCEGWGGVGWGWSRGVYCAVW